MPSSLAFHSVTTGARSESIEGFSEIAQDLFSKGADSILLGCTELELLTRGGTSGTSFVDSARIHADAAWEASIGRRSLSEFQTDVPT